MRFLIAFMLLCVPAHAAIVKISDGIYVDMPIITQAEIDQMTAEKQAEINNMTVEFNRAIAQKQAELGMYTNMAGASINWQEAL